MSDKLLNRCKRWGWQSDMLKLVNAHMSRPNNLHYPSPLLCKCCKQDINKGFSYHCLSIKLKIFLLNLWRTNSQITACVTYTQGPHFKNWVKEVLKQEKTEIRGFALRKLVLAKYVFTCSTYMHREDESKHVPPFSQGLFLSTQRNPVEIGEIG